MNPFSIINKSFKHTYMEVLERTHYTSQQKLIIKRRYVEVVVSAQSHYTYMRFAYFLFTIAMTLCGVLVASFASFERISSNITNSTVDGAFVWVIWALGIIIAVCGNLLHVLNIPKKYVLNRVILGKLQSEGWLFVSGVGRYATIFNLDDRFKLFCTRVEKIRMKAIETMPEMGASGEANDILSSGFDDSARDVEPTPQTNLKASRRSKFTLPVKRAIGLSRSAEIPKTRDNKSTPLGESKDSAANDDVNNPNIIITGVDDNIADVDNADVADAHNVTINM